MVLNSKDGVMILNGELVFRGLMRRQIDVSCGLVMDMGGLWR